MTDPRLVSFNPDQSAASIVIDPRMWPPTREGVASFVAFMRELIETYAPEDIDPDAPLWRIERPCGRLYEFDTVEDFPVFDLPCGCGDPDCVVIEWREAGDA